MPNPDTTLLVEAILLVASEPLTASQLAAATGRPESEVTPALTTLAGRLNGGIRLSELHGRYQLVTAPAAGPTVEAFLQAETKTELSRPALETLAIVAYRGPIAKSGIEAIRGVNTEAMLRNLTGRGLIEEAGRSTEAGRPILYTVSHNFLQHLGLTSPHDLPPLAAESDQPEGHEN